MSSQKRQRSRATRVVRGPAIQESGPPLSLGLLDVQILPDRQHPRFLQPARGRLPAGQRARHGLRHAHRPRLDRRLPLSPDQAAGPGGLLHLGRGRDLVPATRGRGSTSTSSTIDEKQHEEIQRRRRNIYDLHDYIRDGADHRVRQPHVPELPHAQLPAALLRRDAADVRRLRGQERRDGLPAQPPRRGPDGGRAGEAGRGLARRGLRRPHPRASRPRLHGGRGGHRLGLPREGPTRAACFVWGSEMGFRMLLSDVYRMVFRYYGSVLDWKNPEFTRVEKARHLALAACGAPFSAAGSPLRRSRR